MYGGITGEFSEPIQDDIEQTIEASSEQRKGEETLLIFRSSECSDEQRKKLRELVRYMEIPCSVVTSSPKAPRCPLCKQLKRKTRKIAIFNGMVQALAEVFRYCERKGSFEFTTREIKRDYLEPYGTNVTARFGDWDYFGGLILAKRNTDGIKAKGAYLFDVDRTRAFLKNEIAIPTIIEIFADGTETKKQNFKFIGDIPSVADQLSPDGEYIGYK